MMRGLWQRLERWDHRLSRRIAQGIRGPQGGRPWPRILAHVGAHLGDSVLWWAVLAWLWRRSRTPHQRRRVMGWGVALMLALVGVLAIKPWIRRVRPGRGRLLYGPGADVYSFPSGHGARAGVIWVWLSQFLPLGRWLGLGLALWIGWSRVALGIHYLGDVVGGLLLGVVIGRWTRGRWGGSSPTEPGPSSRPSPGPAPGGP